MTTSPRPRRSPAALLAAILLWSLTAVLVPGTASAGVGGLDCTFDEQNIPTCVPVEIGCDYPSGAVAQVVQCPTGPDCIHDDYTASQSQECYPPDPCYDVSSDLPSKCLDRCESIQAEFVSERPDPCEKDDTPRAQPDLTLDITADPPTARPGDTVVFTYLVTNNGQVDLVDVALTDEGLTSFAVAGGFARRSASAIETLFSGERLDHGDSISTTTSHVVTTSDYPGPLSRSGTATATGASDSDSVEVPLVFGPQIDVTVTPDVDELLVDGPASITWTYVVTNVGETPLESVVLDESLGGALALDATTLAPGESTTATRTRDVTDAEVAAGSVTSEATADGWAPIEGAVQDTDAATVALSQPEQESEVLGVVEERPAPAPAPEPQPEPAPAVAAETLPATGGDGLQAGALGLFAATLGLWVLVQAADRRRAGVRS